MYSCLFYNLYAAATTTTQGRSCNSAAALFFESFLNNNVPFGSINQLTEFIHNVLNETHFYRDEDIITIHAESTKHLNRAVMAVKELGLKVGVALNPATPLNVLDHILEELDMVLIMTVNPGFGGQKYIGNMTEKISALKTMIQERNLDVDIEVDGGIKMDNVDEVLKAGANVIVAGSAVFGDATEENARAFVEKLSK